MVSLIRSLLLFAALLLVGVAPADAADDLADNVEAASAAECDGTLDLWCNLSKLTREVVLDVVEIVQDVFAWIFDQLMSLFIYIVGLLPPLDFAAIDWDGLGFLSYFADRLHIDVALGIVGAGLLFRLSRKVLTLGWW